MARALAQIMAELNSTFNPQRDVYNEQINQIDPQMQAEEQGLKVAQQDSFGEITQGANRRGLLFSGIPIAEQARYTGQTFLPAVANLKAKYLQQKFNLRDALAKIDQDQLKMGYDIYGNEVAMDEAARARAASAASGGGFQPSYTPANTQTPQAPPAPQLTLRQQWQKEASAGDWNAQVALNYAGDDGRFDGPVNSQAEYDILKKMGIRGNFYVRGSSGGGW